MKQTLEQQIYNRKIMPTHTPGSQRLDYYLSVERDFPQTEIAGIRYLICSSPRCGSTLFGQMLRDTGIMGDPLEYLNPEYLDAYFRRFGGNQDSIHNIISRLEKIRTSPNGNFGLQLHFRHFAQIFGDPDSAAALSFLRGFDRVLFIRRLDRIGQALSLYRARTTGIWSSLEADFRQLSNDHAAVVATPVPFDPLRLTQALQGIIMQDIEWQNLLQRHQIPHLEICYEELVQNWSSQCKRAIAYLGSEISAGNIPAQKLRKQAQVGDPLRNQLLEYMGISTKFNL